MIYVATINTPGYLPWDDEPPTFATIKEAWEWLAEQFEAAHDDVECPNGDCERGARVMRQQTHCGGVHTHSPGYDGDHDLGLMYSVTPVI